MEELEDRVAGTAEAAPVELIIVDSLFLEGRREQLWRISYNWRSLIAESVQNEKREFLARSNPHRKQGGWTSRCADHLGRRNLSAS
jgi:hypothetical protein